MGNIHRFVEPVLLLMLREKRRSYGYDLSSALKEYALTDAEIEGAALYRTLKPLEANGHVKSDWEVQGSGPARHLYFLTGDGDRHLEEWGQVLDHLSKAMTRFVRRVRQPDGPRTNSKRAASPFALPLADSTPRRKSRKRR